MEDDSGIERRCVVSDGQKGCMICSFSLADTSVWSFAPVLSIFPGNEVSVAEY